MVWRWRSSCTYFFPGPFFRNEHDIWHENFLSKWAKYRTGPLNVRSIHGKSFCSVKCWMDKVNIIEILDTSSLCVRMSWISKKWDLGKILHFKIFGTTKCRVLRKILTSLVDLLFSGPLPWSKSTWIFS